MTSTRILLFLLISIFLSCSKDEGDTSKDEGDTPETITKNSEKELISFKFTIDEQNYEAEIRNDSILAVLTLSN